MKQAAIRHHRRRHGFTLMELLVATMIFAVLAAALYGVFSGALRLRERAYASVEQELTSAGALDVMRRDLNGLIITTGTLATPMLGTTNRQGQQSNDMLEFNTTAGVMYEQDDQPWGDVEKVNYSLEEPATPGKMQGRELVRTVWRNIYSQSEDTPQMARLLGGVRSLRFEYLDQQSWVDSWDSTTDNRPPQAVRVTIEFEAQPPADGQAADPNRDRPRPPLMLMCGIAAQPKADDSSTSGTAL